MKKYSVLLALIALALVSLACQTLSGDNSGAPELPPGNDAGVESQPTQNGESGGTTGVKSDFPLPDGATNVQELGGSTNFQVKMSLDEAMKFYMEALTSKGYTERTISTVTSDTTFSMVFEGHESGKIIVVQGVDLGDGSVNVNIRLEDV
jgi:hypothetical protein